MFTWCFIVCIVLSVGQLVYPLLRLGFCKLENGIQEMRRLTQDHTASECLDSDQAGNPDLRCHLTVLLVGLPCPQSLLSGFFVGGDCVRTRLQEGDMGVVGGRAGSGG